MSYNPPSIQSIRDRLLSVMSGKLSETIPLLPKSFLLILSTALAGKVTLLYKTLGWVFLQMFPSTASYTEVTILGKTITPLIEWGRALRVGDPRAATKFQGEIEFATVGDGVIPKGTLIRGPNGLLYASTAAVDTEGASTITLTFEALDAGSEGNLVVGAQVSLSNPSAIIDRTGEVLTVTVTAEDAEDEDSYRQQVEDALQKPRRGSAYADFEDWGEEPVGIRAVYPYSSDLADAQVDIYVESVSGVPTEAELAAVTASLYQPDRRQANTLYNVLPVHYKEFSVEIQGFVISENEVECKAAITEALDDYFGKREPYIGGLSIPPAKDVITHAAIVGVIASVAESYAALFTGAVVTSASSLVQVYSLAKGQLAALDVVTYA